MLMAEGQLSRDAAHQDVPDYLRAGLKLVIVGINPGMRSGQSGHHYAFRGNHFWPLLYDAGLLPEPLTCAEDQRVLEYDIGLTNLVDRTSRAADELSKAELQAGAASLKAKLLQYRPRVVCFNGMGIYEAFSGRKKVTPGLQEERLEGMLMFVMPSSSGRTAAYLRPAKLALYRELRDLVERVSAEAVAR
jgi:mismatch-specific thymine-DNA glycosylase